MIVHEHARRGQILSACKTAAEPARKRLAGKRSDTTDDKGRPVMPFDLIVFRERRSSSREATR